MPGGRPRTYKPEMVKKARNYIDQHLDFGDPVPTVAGLACVLGVVRETCHAWAKDEDKPEFSHILRELAQKQERVLIANGLKGEFNAPITKMMLTKHGYSDKVENDHTSSDGSMTPKDGGSVLERINSRLDSILAARSEGGGSGGSDA